MEQRGVINSWNDDKGFGFIQPEQGGGALFVHISAMRGDRRPQAGETVLFIAGQDQHGRWRAEHMRFEALSLDRPAIRRKPRPAASKAAAPAKPAAPLRRSAVTPARAVQHLPLKLLVFVGLCGMPLYGSLQLLLVHGFIWALGAYGLLSLVSFCQYWMDKHSAQKGRWRTPENTLQLTALLGGWPGAWLAQQVFRHKTRKLSFQLPFALIVLAHQLFWFDWLVLQGRYFGHFLRALLAY